MTSRLLAVVHCALLVGCSIEMEGTGDVAIELSDSTAAADTNVSIEDASAPVADTTTPDTEPLDSGAPDTELPDTAPVDSGAPDTAPMEDTAPVGTVTVSSKSVGSGTFNLTTEGTRDWGHWGHEMSDSFNEKSMASAITKGTRMGAGTFESSVFRFSWSDGSAAPTMVTETPRGLSMTTPGESVTFDVQGASTAERTLEVWASGTSNGILTGTLVGTSVAPASVSLGAGIYLVTFKFRTGGTLRVEVKKDVLPGSFNLFAAALK